MNYDTRMKHRPPALSNMEKEEFDSRMAAGLADAKAGRGIPVDVAFDKLFGGLTENEVVMHPKPKEEERTFEPKKCGYLKYR